MGLTEDENLKKCENCGHCGRNILLPYDYEWTCVSCNYNVVKRKHELSKFQREQIDFISRLKYAEHKIFCICIDVYKKYEGINFDKIFEALSTLKNEKLQINNRLIEKYKDMCENPDFEQNQYSITSEGIHKIGHESIRLMKWLA